MSNEKNQNGYTKIFHFIMDGLITNKLNGTQYRILLLVLRYTYGFHRDYHDFSLTFLAKALNIDKSYVRKELNTLIELDILMVVAEAGFNKPRKLKINNDINAWRVNKTSQGKITSTLGEKEDFRVVENYHTTGDQNNPSTVDKLIYQEIKDKEINKEVIKDEDFLY